MHKLYLCIFFVFLCGNIHANSAVHTATKDTIRVIENFHNHLLESMQAGENWTYTKRYEFLSPVILASFDFEKMSRLVLSRNWRKLSADEQKNFTELMQRLTTATYSSRFAEYNHEKLTVLSSENIKKQRVAIKTQITTADKVYELNYVLHKPSDKWLIISIMANGINELAIKRAEYASILKTDNFGALTQQIEKQISRLKTQ